MIYGIYMMIIMYIMRAIIPEHRMPSYEEDEARGSWKPREWWARKHAYAYLAAVRPPRLIRLSPFGAQLRYEAGIDDDAP